MLACRRAPGMWTIALLATGIGVVLAGDANASEAPFSVEYHVPADCPDAADFQARVLDRVKKKKLSVAIRPLVLRVTVESLGDSRTGTLVVGGQSRAPRMVSGETCDAVIDALALVAAVSLDREPHAVRSPSLAAQTPLHQQEKLASRPWWGMGGQLRATRGFRPGWAAEGGAFVDYGIGKRGVEWSGWAARLSFVRSLQSSLNTEIGSVNIQRTVGRIDLCPASIMLGAPLGLRTCAGFDAGQLRVSGREGEIIRAPAVANVVWLSTGASMHLVARPAAMLTVEANVVADLVLRKHKFAFNQPDSLLYSTSPFMLSAGLAVGLLFF